MEEEATAANVFAVAAALVGHLREESLASIDIAG